ncbi:oligosaccharide flippase family protein [Photobacterium angustum]|uniref:Polysaccharide biosynthesis protein C-terminal domain-containing protein n=1 Tax=Photobacterium angustum TaxID=661 RepID=A0A2S7VWU1_PHOAN|nr:oligosaccharide flippase family protein [Photobacterium angustum]PQJ66355.1 hypothetical protein BTO08_02430 [Photobacterium angustum]
MSLYFKNSLWIMLEKIALNFGGLIAYVLVSNYLGPDKFGLISFAISLTLIPITISQWGANHVVSNYTLIDKSKSISIIYGSLHFRILIFITSSLLIYLFLLYNNKGLYNSNVILVFLISHIFIGLDIYQFYFLSSNNSKINALSSLLSRTIAILLRVLFVYLSLEVYWFSFPFLVFGIINFYIKSRKVKGLNNEIKKPILKDFIFNGFPYLLSSLLTIVYMKVNDYLIISMVDMKSLAIYNVALTLGFAWTFIPQSFSLSFLNKALSCNNFDKSRKELFKTHLFVCALSIPIIIFIFFFSKDIIGLLFSDSYSNASEILPLLSIAGLFSILGVFNNRIIGYFEEGKSYLYKKVFVTSIISLFIGWFLVSSYGLIGAVYSLCITELFSFTVANYFFKRGLIFKIHFNLR